MIIVFWKSPDGNGTYSSEDEWSSYSMGGNGLSVGHYREYHGTPNILDNLRNSDLSSKKSDLSFDLKGLALSVEDKKYIQDLRSQKLFSFQDLSPSQQRRLRNTFNEYKKAGQPEIQYEDINPSKDSYNPEYVQMLLAYHNALIDNRIYDKIYEKEYQNVQDLPEENMFAQIEAIPQDKRSEILQWLIVNSSGVSLQKKDIQKKIVAIFMTDARKMYKNL